MRVTTIPWDKVDIEVMTIETNHAGEIFPGTKQEIRDYLADKGYVYAHTVGRIFLYNHVAEHVSILLFAMD